MSGFKRSKTLMSQIYSSCAYFIQFCVCFCPICDLFNKDTSLYLTIIDRKYRGNKLKKYFKTYANNYFEKLVNHKKSFIHQKI